MRMFILLLSVLLFKVSSAQRLPFSFRSYAISLSATTDGSLVVHSKAGEIAIAENINGPWRTTTIGDFSVTEGAAFFNKALGIFGGQGISTNDGANTFQRLQLDQNGPVDDAFCLPNGKAWLSVAGSGIAYSQNFGRDWMKIEIPEIRQRFHRIFFRNNGEGIIGSVWDRIAITKNNGETWKMIATPMNQQAYKKTSTGSRPEINKVALYKSSLICVQEDMVFVSPADSIQWKQLLGYNEFFTDADNSAIFFKTRRNSLEQLSDDFLAVTQRSSIIANYLSASCVNSKLYILTSDSICTIDQSNAITKVALGPVTDRNTEPDIVAYTRNGILGTRGNKVYLTQDIEEKQLMVLNGWIEGKSAIRLANDSTICYQRGDDSLFYFNFDGKKIDARSVSGMIESFSKSGIRTIKFDQGTSGCFHRDVSIATFTNEGDYFALDGDPKVSANKNFALPDVSEIDKQPVDKLIKILPAIFSGEGSATIDDINFTEKDYVQCKRDVIAFKESLLSPAGKKKKQTKFSLALNNLDVDKLISLVDAIKDSGNTALSEVLLSRGDFISTTSFWKTAEFINDKNQHLTISYSYWADPATFIPWQISVDGYNVFSTNLAISNFFNAAYPGFLPKPNKVQLLHEIVKVMYTRRYSP